MAQGIWETLVTLMAPGTAVTAAARTSMTGGTNATAARFSMPGNALKYLGDQILVEAEGVISCVVTTPGTARFDFALGTSLGTAIMDTGAMPLNIVARTSVPWALRMKGTVTTIGTAAVLTWNGWWLSEAMINTPLQATGPGPGGTSVPYSGTATGASTASASFNSTISNIIDLNFTQTVATGSCTLNQMNVSILTATGF
jgi:hypothetical protein